MTERKTESVKPAPLNWKLKRQSQCAQNLGLLSFLCFALLVAVLSAERSEAAQYLNCGDTEATINSGTAPNGGTTLMCDDFEDGSWYVTNADTSGGRNNAANDGWDGNIFASIPADNCTSSSGGAVGTSITSRGAAKSGGYGSTCAAFHYFAPSESTYDEIYHRFYTRPGDTTTSYQFGHEKWVFYQQTDTNTTQTVLLGTQSGSDELEFLCMQCDQWYSQNQGNTLAMQNNHWYAWEVHIKLNTSDGASDGVLELWGDDCGTAGTACTGTPTLRLRHTGLRMRYAANPIYPGAYPSLGVIHQENYCSSSPQPQCLGQPYNDQVVVSTARIGWMTEGGGGGGGGTLVLIRAMNGLIIAGGVLNSLFMAGWFWQRRTVAVQAAVKFWRYAAEVPDLYWQMRYRWAVKKWLKKAPPMLEHKHVVTIELPKKESVRADI